MRSVHVLVPDALGLERNFHDVTIVDMGDSPEVSVSRDDLSMLRRQWPATVLRHMVWLQQDTMRAEARKRFRNAKPGNCSECHKWIKCDMYRHVATTWRSCGGARCPGAQCGRAHRKIAWIMFGGHMMCHGMSSQPVWRRLSPHGQFGARWDLLAANHSRISTDVLLFNDIHLSLTHHYRVHKRGLPHIAFMKTYLTRLHALVSKASGQSLGDMSSPVKSSPVSSRHARSAEREPETPRHTRRGRRRLRPVRILEEAVGELPTLTAHYPSNLQGAIVYDCRPPLLPVSL